jgi:hypothetical protein
MDLYVYAFKWEISIYIYIDTHTHHSYPTSRKGFYETKRAYIRPNSALVWYTNEGQGHPLTATLRQGVQIARLSW